MNHVRVSIHLLRNDVLCCSVAVHGGTIAKLGICGLLADSCVRNHCSTLCSLLRHRNAHHKLWLRKREGLAQCELGLEARVGFCRSKQGERSNLGAEPHCLSWLANDSLEAAGGSLGSAQTRTKHLLLREASLGTSGIPVSKRIWDQRNARKTNFLPPRVP